MFKENNININVNDNNNELTNANENHAESKDIQRESFEFSKCKLINKDLGLYIYTEEKTNLLKSQNIVFCAVMKLKWHSSSEPCHLILYDKHFKDLPKYIQEFFIFHEEGHVYNRDLYVNVKTLQENFDKRLSGTLLDEELEADKYSANKIGIEKCMNALLFMLQNTNLGLIPKLELINRYNALCSL